MLINVICPRCGTNYHLDETLRGKPMRCHVAACRHVFIVGTTEPEAVPARPDPNAGHVGDLVPLLSAELEVPESRTPHVSDMVEMLPARAATDTAWMEPPPVRRQVPGQAPLEAPAPPKKPKTHIPKTKANGPRGATPMRRSKDEEQPT